MLTASVGKHLFALQRSKSWSPDNTQRWQWALAVTHNSHDCLHFFSGPNKNHAADAGLFWKSAGAHGLARSRPPPGHQPHTQFNPDVYLGLEWLREHLRDHMWNFLCRYVGVGTCFRWTVGANISVGHVFIGHRKQKHPQASVPLSLRLMSYEAFEDTLERLASRRVINGKNSIFRRRSTGRSYFISFTKEGLGLLLSILPAQLMYDSSVLVALSFCSLSTKCVFRFRDNWGQRGIVDTHKTCFQKT